MQNASVGCTRQQPSPQLAFSSNTPLPSSHVCAQLTSGVRAPCLAESQAAHRPLALLPVAPAPPHSQVAAVRLFSTRSWISNMRKAGATPAPASTLRQRRIRRSTNNNSSSSRYRLSISKPHCCKARWQRLLAPLSSLHRQPAPSASSSYQTSWWCCRRLPTPARQQPRHPPASSKVLHKHTWLMQCLRQAVLHPSRNMHHHNPCCMPMQHRSRECRRYSR